MTGQPKLCISAEQGIRGLSQVTRSMVNMEPVPATPDLPTQELPTPALPADSLIVTQACKGCLSRMIQESMQGRQAVVACKSSWEGWYQACFHCTVRQGVVTRTECSSYQVERRGQWRHLGRLLARLHPQLALEPPIQDSLQPARPS